MTDFVLWPRPQFMHYIKSCIHLPIDIWATLDTQRANACSISIPFQSQIEGLSAIHISDVFSELLSPGSSGSSRVHRVASSRNYQNDHYELPMRSPEHHGWRPSGCMLVTCPKRENFRCLILGSIPSRHVAVSPGTSFDAETNFKPITIMCYPWYLNIYNSIEVGS